MNLLDFFLSKKEDKSKEHEAHFSTVMGETPRIRHLEQQIEQLQKDASQKEEVNKQLDTKLANYIKVEETVKLAELEEMKLRDCNFEQENLELAKHTSLTDYNFKNTQIQKLVMQLKKSTKERFQKNLIKN